jgi:hypothetical protein
MNQKNNHKEGDSLNDFVKFINWKKLSRPRKTLHSTLWSFSWISVDCVIYFNELF